jgi:hypothetical protein
MSTKAIYDDFISGRLNLYIVAKHGAKPESLNIHDIPIRKEADNMVSVIMHTKHEDARELIKSFDVGEWEILEITGNQYSSFYYRISEADRPRMCVRIA